MVVHRHGRRTIFFSDHSLDRWWERCEDNDTHGRKQALDLLEESMGQARWEREPPPWTRLSLYHRGRADGYLLIADNKIFVINRNANRDLVAVTYLEQGRWDR